MNILPTLNPTNEKKTRGLVSHTVRLQRGYVIVLPSPSPNLDKRVWTDFGAEYTNDCSEPLQTAREAVESFVDVSLGASSVELTGVQEPLITKHYLVDCAAPPTPHPGLNFVMKRFTRMPPGSQLHPNLYMWHLKNVPVEVGA